MAQLGLSMGISAREPVKRIGVLAKRADELGFDAMWVIDSHLVMGDAYVCMAVAATNSSKIKLGTGVTNPKTRHPTVTANAIASIDELSNGRACLGVGTGDSALEPLGLRATRIVELEQFVEETKALLSGQPIEGSWSADREHGEVKLARPRPDVPVFVAATQPRMLRAAARHADGIILLGFADLEVIEWQLAHIEAGLQEADRTWSDLFIDYWATISVQEDREQALADTRSWAAGQARWLSRWTEVPPRLEPFKQEAHLAAEQYDFKEHLSLRASHAHAASDEFVQLAAISGTPEECLPRVREIATHPHVNRVTMTLLSGKRDQRLEQLAQIGDQL